MRPSETEPPAATPPALAEGSMGPGLCIDTEYLGPPSRLSISHPPPPEPSVPAEVAGHNTLLRALMAPCTPFPDTLTSLPNPRNRSCSQWV